jgi:small subunit ribosomal protein S5
MSETPNTTPAPSNNSRPSGRGGNNGGNDRSGGFRRRSSEPRVPSEFEEKVLEVNRVTRVVKGGKRMRFRALVVIGDRKKRVAFGLGKAADVTTAVAKAVAAAKKDMLNVYLHKGTLPYRVIGIHKSAEVLIKPATPGTGLIAGGAVRTVLELAGVQDAVAKMLGSANKISNVMASMDALRQLTSRRELLANRGIVETRIKPDVATEEAA